MVNHILAKRRRSVKKGTFNTTKVEDVTELTLKSRHSRQNGPQNSGIEADLTRMMLRVVHVRKSRLFSALVISVIFTVSVIISFLHKSDLYHRVILPGKPQDGQDALQKGVLAINKESFSLAAKAPFSTAEEDTLPHRTCLITRTRCTQKLFLLILVLTAPGNIGRRNIIRKTWASDPSMNIRWKTMFLLGQAKDSTQEKYLEAEGLMYNDFIRGAQRENYKNLTLKTEMGLEWAAKYCDFQFLLKADDDVFVNPYRLMDYLGNPDTPKTKLYLGYVRHNRRPHRGGKYGVTMKDYNKTRYPDFCSGLAYVLSSDLVHKLVPLFDVNKPLKLEDVFIGTLVEKLGVTAARHHQGFRPLQFGPCKYYSDIIAYHRASINCMDELFNLVMKERLEGEFNKSRRVKTEENKQLSMLVEHDDTRQTEHV